MKDNFTEVRRQIRWSLDNLKLIKGIDVVGSIEEVLGQSYELLRETELLCLNKKNEKKGKCIFEEE